MPEKPLTQPSKVSRSFAIGIGVTEIFYLLGLFSLAAGVGLLFGFAWALVMFGIVLIGTAFKVQSDIDKGTNN